MWTDSEILYHIYPLGACGAPVENDGITVGRILTIKNYIPHLKKLGVGGVYFSPLFESDRHGYDTRDYFKIDCRLGTNEDFKSVCDELHKNGIKVILDGVFNHVGRGFYQFQDVLKNRENSAYKDWFYINFGGNTHYNDGLWYDAWEKHYELVKLNLHNPAVTDYLFKAIEFWINEFKIDGLRLDVAYCLDRNFMKSLRNFAKQKKDFVLIGEVLFGDYNQFVNDNMLHSCTNYENYKSLYSSFNTKNLFELSYSLNRQFGYDNWCIYRNKHLVTFTDNHDVSRFATILSNKNLIKLGYGTLFTMPGIPTLYYGSEWGMEGDKKDGDNALRPFVEYPQQNSLTEDIKRFIQIRKSNPVFSFGGYKNIVEANEFLVFERAYNGKRALVGLNISQEVKTAHQNSLSGNFKDAVTGMKETLNGNFVLPPESITILIGE